MNETHRGQCLTLIGTAHIQDYVFRSNRLKENAGASELVRAALDAWNESRHRIVFVGGGNAALLFQSEAEAREAVWHWSLDWMRRAPGLCFTVAHQTIGDSVRQAWREAQRKLRDHEERPPFGYELGALPVVRTCQSTGRAATGQEDQRQAAAWLSPEALKKREAAAAAADRLHNQYAAELRGWYQFPNEFSDLGQKEGASHIAIVHADGNSVGRLFRELGEDPPLDGSPFLEALHALSEAVTNLARAAFGKTAADLSDIHHELRDREDWIRLPLAKEGPPYLPLRPLVDSGDDLTFVAHGKLGIALAARYLEHFRRESIVCLKAFAKYPGQYWTASAGVLIAPEKFPFARGYRMAEELTRAAKAARTEDLESENPDAGWLDFHVQLEGAAGSLHMVRETQYGTVEGGLLRRPYRLSREPDDPHGWHRFQELSVVFRDPGRVPRSRAKALLQALARGGPAPRQVMAACEAAGIVLPETMQSETEYWDALELLDFHRDPWLERSVNHAAA